MINIRYSLLKQSDTFNDVNMDKQLDAMIGKGNREMIASMLMGGAAKDAAAVAVGSFIGVFFNRTKIGKAYLYYAIVVICSG